MSSLVKYDSQEINELKVLVKIAAESKQYSNLSEAQMLSLMLSAKALGLHPQKAINGSFYVLQGKVCMSTSLMSDMIRKAGHSVKIVEMGKDKCVIIAQRKDNGDSLKFEYTMEDASLAGLSNGPTWKKFPKQMLYNRCMSTVARTLFSDVIGNAYDPDEHQDIQDIPAEKRPDIDPEIVITLDSETGEVSKVYEEPVIEKKASEKQVAFIDSLIKKLSDPDLTKALCEFYKVDCLAEISLKDAAKVIEKLQSRIDQKIQEMQDRV